MSNCPKCQAEVNKDDNFCRSCGHPLHDSLTGEKPQGFDNIRETSAYAPQPSAYAPQPSAYAPQLSAYAPQPQYNIKEQLVQMLGPLLEPFQSQLQELIQKQNNNTASLEAEREEINQINNEISKLKEELQRQLEEEILTPFQSQLQELTQKQNNNIAFLEAEREKNNQINNEISKIKEELQQQLKDELRPIKELIGLFGEWFKNNPEYLPFTTTIDPQVKLQTSTELNTTREVEEEGKYQLPLSEEEQLLKDYKDEKKRDILSQNAITVSAATESIDNSRLGIGKSVLEKKRRGNYWILKQGSSQYLVPSDTININEYSMDTLKKLFECQGVNSEGSKGKFELLKPAKVSSIGEEKWQLSEPGKLEFIG
ncbi:MAG: zinc ribbon domain-containing protein [Trichodesmium sp. MAG_R02]|nr:zinc ribbon domain-containing protein [Trichodesmium sp. MAG_R02]